MKLTKSGRDAVLAKSGARCWYCGTNLSGTRWQADHFHPIVRLGGNGCMYPLLDTVDNLVPACGPCNHYKSDMAIERFRSNVIRQREATLKASTGLRQLHRLGRVEFKEDPVVFWFEQEGLQVPDMMALMGISEAAEAVEWREERSEPGCYYADIGGFVVTVRRLRGSHTNLAIMTGADWQQTRFEFDGGCLTLIAAQWALDAIARGCDKEPADQQHGIPAGEPVAASLPPPSCTFSGGEHVQ